MTNFRTDGSDNCITTTAAYWLDQYRYFAWSQATHKKKQQPAPVTSSKITYCLHRAMTILHGVAPT